MDYVFKIIWVNPRLIVCAKESTSALAAPHAQLAAPHAVLVRLCRARRAELVCYNGDISHLKLRAKLNGISPEAPDAYASARKLGPVLLAAFPRQPCPVPGGNTFGGREEMIAADNQVRR